MSGFQNPKVRSIVIGILIFCVAFYLFLSLGEVIKTIGAPFLYLPSWLGLVQRVTPEQVIPIELNSQTSAIEIKQPGRYAVYTDDLDLLMMTDELVSTRAAPWLVVRPQGGTRLTIEVIERGLRPYDTPLAKGRPIFVFTAQQPGIYELAHPARKVFIWVVPDTFSGNESVIGLAYLVQIAILLAPFLWWGYRRYERASQLARSHKLETQARTDSFWKMESHRRQMDEMKKQSNPYKPK